MRVRFRNMHFLQISTQGVVVSWLSNTLSQCVICVVWRHAVNQLKMHVIFSGWAALAAHPSFVNVSNTTQFYDIQFLHGGSPPIFITVLLKWTSNSLVLRRKDHIFWYWRIFPLRLTYQLLNLLICMPFLVRIPTYKYHIKWYHP